MMIRKAFKMKLLPNKIEEYTKQHNPIWLDIYDTLKEYGVHNYSIFHDKNTNDLFGYAEIESEELWNAIASTQACKKWWDYMADLMETNEDNSPVSMDLESVFFIK